MRTRRELQKEAYALADELNLFKQRFIDLGDDLGRLPDGPSIEDELAPNPLPLPLPLPEPTSELRELSAIETHVFEGNQNEVLLDGVHAAIEGERRQFIIIRNTKNCVVRRVSVHAPHNQEWFLDWNGLPGPANSRGVIPTVLYFENNENLTFEDIDVSGGHTTFKGVGNKGTQARRIRVRSPQRHGIMFSHEGFNTQGEGLVLENFLVQHRDSPELLHTGGATDSVIFWNCRDPHDGARLHYARHGLAEGGHGNYGSGALVDGNLGGYPETGAVQLSDFIAVNSSNLAVAITDGRNSIMSGVIGWQLPSSRNVRQSSSNRPAGVYDYTGKIDVAGNCCKTWKNNRIVNSRFRWATEDKNGLTAFRKPLPAQTEDRDWGVCGHPDDGIYKNNVDNDETLTQAYMEVLLDQYREAARPRLIAGD